MAYYDCDFQTGENGNCCAYLAAASSGEESEAPLIRALWGTST